MFDFIVLCIVQGLTEILPISSSGHLAIANVLFSGKDISITTVVLLHFISVLVIFYVLKKYLKSNFEFFGYAENVSHNSKNKLSKLKFRNIYHQLLLLVMVSCISTMIPAYFLKDKIEAIFKTVNLIGYALLLNGLIVYALAKIPKGEKRISDLSINSAILIGFAQCCGIVPGISRMGVTLLMALFCGLNWRSSVLYSFMISLPIIVLATIYKFISSDSYNLNFGLDTNLLGMGLGYLLTMVLIYFSAKILLGRIGPKSMPFFASWCWIVGLLTVIYLG